LPQHTVPAVISAATKPWSIHIIAPSIAAADQLSSPPVPSIDLIAHKFSGVLPMSRTVGVASFFKKIK
jgi:hypothetical protein